MIEVKKFQPVAVNTHPNCKIFLKPLNKKNEKVASSQSNEQINTEPASHSLIRKTMINNVISQLFDEKIKKKNFDSDV